MNKEYISEWKKKHTFYTFIAQAFLYGLATTVVQTSCWEYVNSLVHPSNRQLFYGITSSVVFIGPMLFGACVLKWIRRSRELRSSMFLFNMALLVGTICYMVPSHPILPVIGRFFNGSILIVQSIMYSEMTRAYPDERLKVRIQIFITSVTLGKCQKNPPWKRLFNRGRSLIPGKNYSYEYYPLERFNIPLCQTSRQYNDHSFFTFRVCLN